MTTSATTEFTLDLTEAVEEAFERCGGEVRTGYDLRTARRSLNLLFADWANRGLNLWTIEQGSIAVVAGTSAYDLPTDTIDLLELVLRTGSGSTQFDMPMARISVSTYATLPNKEAEGRPVQFWINRLSTTQSIKIWPEPDDATTYTLVYWRLRRIQDAGNGAETPDVPFRFLPCLVAGLAYYLALKVPGGMDRIEVLKAQYDDAWQLASEEDRERAPVRFVPRIEAV